MKILEHNLIFLLLLVVCTIFKDTAFAQGSSALTLSVLEEKVVMNPQKRSTVLHLRIVNQSNKKFKLYSFHNDWNPLLDIRYIPDLVQLGLNLAVFNDKDEYFFPPQGFSHSIHEFDYVEVFMTKGVDSALAMLEKSADSLKLLLLEKKQRIINSTMWVSPGHSIETVLEINLSDYSLKKGRYNFEVYYVINKRIFEYTEKSDDLFVGCLKSNQIQLIIN